MQGDQAAAHYSPSPLKMLIPKQLPFAELQQALFFLFVLFCFENQVLLPREQRGESILSIYGGLPSKSSIRMARGLQDEALQGAGANREMCYF